MFERSVAVALVPRARRGQCRRHTAYGLQGARPSCRLRDGLARVCAASGHRLEAPRTAPPPIHCPVTSAAAVPQRSHQEDDVGTSSRNRVCTRYNTTTVIISAAENWQFDLAHEATLQSQLITIKFCIAPPTKVLDGSA